MGREQASRPGTFLGALTPDLWQDHVLVFPGDAPVCPPLLTDISPPALVIPFSALSSPTQLSGHLSSSL